MKRKKYTIFVCLLMVVSITSCASTHTAWDSLLKLFNDDEEPATASSLSLTNSEIIAGLKEALSKGTQSAVDNLGRIDGFFGNPKVKIPMPKSLHKVEKALRAVKQDKVADDFVLAMNRAAEKAVPQAAQIFSTAIQKMSFKDAKEILQGRDNAATEYFRRTSSADLVEKMLPVVKEATDAVGVTAKYKAMTDDLGVASSLIDRKSLDLDRYITGKAIDGLFRMLAEEEKLIRNDPAARTTELLRKVFSNQ